MNDQPELELTQEEIKFLKEFVRGLAEYSQDHGWTTDSDKKRARDIAVP